MDNLLMLILFAVIVHQLRSQGQSWGWSLGAGAVAVLVGYPFVTRILNGLVCTFIEPPVSYVLVGLLLLGMAVLAVLKIRKRQGDPFK